MTDIYIATGFFIGYHTNTQGSTLFSPVYSVYQSHVFIVWSSLIILITLKIPDKPTVSIS